MAKEAGTNVLLQVSAGSPTEFVTVAGQQSTEFVPGTETDDITDKANTGWGSTLNVLRRGIVNCQGKADWPDTNGLDAIRNAWENGDDIEAKIIFNVAGANYRGFWQITAFNISGTHLNATEYNLTLENNGPLVYAAS